MDELREAVKKPSTWFRPQLEGAGYDPHKDDALDWRAVGREHWEWHQREKAGARIQFRPSRVSAQSKDEEAES